MGRDKALLAVDGVPMARRAADALVAAGVPVGAVVLVGGSPAWAEELGLRWTPDRWPGEGPLGGLATAVLDGPAAAGVAPDPGAIVVVAACDQPWLTGSSLADLIRALEAAPTAAAAASTPPGGRREPFPSAWRSGVGAVLEALVVAGERRADAAYGAVEVVDVAVPRRVVADVDRPGDLPPVP